MSNVGVDAHPGGGLTYEHYITSDLIASVSSTICS